jgi:hypothetical protein
MNGARAIGRRRVTDRDGFPTGGSGTGNTGSSTADTGIGTEPMRACLLTSLLALQCTGCAVVAVADAAVTVVATTVKVGATVVETTVDVAAAGVNAVVGSSDEKKQ